MSLKSISCKELVKPIISFLLIMGCIVFNSNSTLAQTKYLAGNYWVENYTKKQGLPEDVIIDIIQDRKGYIWLVTPYSLVRFDGYEFKIFPPREQFPDLYIHFFPGLLEDSRGTLWMATFETGLFSFDPQAQKFTRYYAGNHPLSISSNDVQAVKEDSKGNIWAGTGYGLNSISYTPGGIKVRQFARQLGGDLLRNFDKIINESHPSVNLTRVGNSETRQAFIDVKETSRYFAVSMGESGDTAMADYGWIENSNGKVIWKHDLLKSLPAGGAAKNRQQLDIIRLTPGTYKVIYKTDDSHAWNSWNTKPPNHPDLWGIQLFKLSPALTDTMDLLIKGALSAGALHNDNIKSLFRDSANNMWALTYAGLEKFQLPADTGAVLITEKIVLPWGFVPGYNLLETTAGQLITTGWFDDTISKKVSPVWLDYDYKKNTYRVNTGGISVLAAGNGINQQSNAFVKDRKGGFWMGTFNGNGDGLYIADTATASSTFTRLEISPPSSHKDGQPSFEQIWSMYQDRNGYIWVGSRGNGLYKIKSEKSPVSFIPVSAGKKIDTALTSIAEDGYGNIWLNGGQRGFFKYNSQNRQTSFYNGIKGNTVEGMFFNKKEKAFIVSGKKQTKVYDPAQSVFKTFPVVVPDSLRLVTADAKGNYWAVNKNLTSTHKTFFIYDGKNFQSVPFDSSGNIQPLYRNIHFGRNGNIWLAAAFEGVHLYKLDSVSKTITFVKKFLPEGYDVNDIHEDEDGMVWLGTYDNGLLRLNPSTGTFISFTQKNGLPSNFIIKTITIGKNLWVVTDLGSAFLDKNTGAIHVNKELDEYISQYEKKSRFASFFDFGYLPNVIACRSGEIAFLTKNGFSLFNPMDFSADSVKPVLHIAGLHIGKQSLAFSETQGSELEFSHNQNDLEINYIGLQYDQPLLNQYAYFLKGANDDWVSAGTEKTAHFSNLPAGRYEFFLKSANADKVWSEPQKMFAFVIHPPWWKTWLAYIIYILVFAAAVWSFVKYRSGYLTKENILLETKVQHRTAQLNHSLEELKATQSQLIQSEKMASLGELTAGIAHEIQNPLNFVNNFSEVNTELINEMQQEMDNGNFADAKAISNDIKENEEKINHHGKRADAIVKGMLQHSRTSSGQKEPVDINVMSDEYLRLAYHGLRAKDKSFNTALNTDFDESIGKLNIIPQDVGRVLLNLYNNAFYAVAEKKASSQRAEGAAMYEPRVSVGTRMVNGKVEIAIKDNGNGISNKILDKIFQPFFTTKPTGQGTGLGLSLSYDIIKAHGGELRVNTKEGEYTAFIVILPVG